MNNLQQNNLPGQQLDTFDRRILGALVEDSSQTYAELGRIVGLSAPAVHERVKRLRRHGIIERMSAILNGPAIGKPMVSFVHVDTDGWGKSERMMKIANFPEVEEIHSVAGDTSVILKVRTTDAHALEVLLSQLYILRGVKTTRSYVVLSTYLERTIQAEVTQDWPEITIPPE
ncbi:Lrp/AsnC family leucine-responsive transcriptional regulator [Thalassospira sp. MBR-102]|uniref:AsnC family transcriptional regulator n=1 Tax=Thalassospira xiamenensis M-5 = DSM 17429 TaxID=1123366 RepID=A0AB72U9P9_9PROT|nr:Lrp/AsnC family transcriptional regulator [Thalassospira xiamenensis]AJD50862.1 AsnC family transcriptional regulator [Thalassospira xiamenensis M-5 = DSM 17429]SIT29831.1 transcriptional regulator, AsnC family [Thalassospira xiamenensis M-5 = DSM 17429]